MEVRKWDQRKMSENDWIPRGKYVNGTHYILSGPSSGPLVVTCHGIDGYHYNFNQLAEELNAKGFAVLQYDMLGRGHSQPHKTGLYSMEEHLDQLHSLLEHLQLCSIPYHLLGLSMGGGLAALYAARYIDEIKSLTLLAPAGLMDLPDVALLRQWSCLSEMVRIPIQYMSLQQSWSRTFVQHDGVFKAREDEMFRMKRLAFSHSPTHSHASWQCVMQFPLYGIETHVEKLADKQGLPIHLVFGDKDVIVKYETNFPKWKEILNKGACVPTFTVMPEAGHNILLEHPDESLKLIVDYIASIHASD